jgi:hypothetical protein
MTDISSIPEELLFNVAEYSDIVPEDLSSEYILREMLNLYPYVNLSRELSIAKLYDHIIKLSSDIRRIHNTLKEDYHYHSICVHGSEITMDLGYAGRCCNKYEMIVNSMQLSPLFSTDLISDESYDEYSGAYGNDTLSITLNDMLPQSALSDIWYLTMSPEYSYDTQNRFIGIDEVRGLSLDSLSQNVDTIDEMRSYPGAISRVLKHCRDMKGIMEDIVDRYKIIYSPLSSIPNLWTNEISEGSGNQIRIKYRDEESVDLILHVMNICVDPMDSRGVDMGPKDLDGLHIDQYTHRYYFVNKLMDSRIVQRAIGEMNNMRNLSLLSSLTSK